MKKIFFIKFCIHGGDTVFTEFFSTKEKKKTAAAIIKANGHKIIKRGSVEETELSSNLKKAVDCGFGVRVTPLGLKTK